MSQLKTLLQDRATALDELRKATDDGEKFAEIEARLTDLDAKIDATEKRETKIREIEQAGAQLEARAQQPANTPIRENNPPRVVAGEDRAKFETLGHQLREVHFRAVNGRPMSGGVYEARAASGYSEKIDKDGGLLVQPEFQNDMMPNILSNAGLLGRCDIRNISGDRLIVNQLKAYSKASSATGAAIAYWVDEAGTITASKAEFEKIELQPRKVAALYYATDELLDDAPAMAGEINSAVALELSMAVDEAILRGAGTTSPAGILNSAALISVAKETGQAADSIVAENLVKMWARLYGRSRGNAVWLYNQALDSQLPLLNLASGTAGSLVFMPAGGLTGAPYASLFGRPLIPCEFCSAPGDVGDLVLADLSQYKVALRGGVKAASSIHVQFLTEQTAFRFSMRVDGRTKQTTVITPKYATSDTVSPFVALAARA